MIPAERPPRRARILILYETIYPDFIGGLEVRNFELAGALARRGHDVTLAGFVASPHALPDPDRGGAPLRIVSLGLRHDLHDRLGKRSLRHALRYAWAVFRLDLTAYDAVETANMPYVHLPVLAFRCARLGTPLIVTWYEYWDRYWIGYVGPTLAGAYRAIEWLTARLGNIVMATSALTAGRVEAARGRHDVTLLPCGVDVARVEHAAALGAGAPPGPPLIFVGRLIRHKRLDLLVRAVGLLATGRNAAPLLTLLGDGPERERLEALVSELGLTERIRFIRRVETSDEVFLELSRSRIAVQPSAREGFGLFPLEALAAGRPVVHVRSEESALGELVRDGVEGEGVAAEPESLARALGALLADGPRWERLSRNARLRAAEFDWARLAGRFEERLFLGHGEQRVSKPRGFDHASDPS